MMEIITLKLKELYILSVVLREKPIVTQTPFRVNYQPFASGMDRHQTSRAQKQVIVHLQPTH